MEAHSDQHVVIECPVLRKCRVCGEHKPQTDFYKLAPTKRAKKDILGVGRISRCRHCEISKYLNMDPRLKLLYAARSRAKQNELECTITVDDIVIPEFCPALGIKLEARIGAGRSNREDIGTSPSLDRIDNSKGYIPGNAAVISLRANMIKTDATAAELKAVAAYIDSQPR
jgi:hypothetical protein